MTERSRAWTDFAREVEASGGPTFVPLDGATIDALRGKFDCPPWFEELLRIGYPTSAIGLGHTAWFPPLQDLVAFRDQDHAWPRNWLPIELSGGHRVRFLRSEGTDDQAVWEYYRDDGEPDGVHTAPTDPVWESFDDFLAAMRTFHASAGEDSFVSREGMRWLRPAAVAHIEERLGKARARKSFELFDLMTPDDVRVVWESERRTALYSVLLTGLLTALATAFLFMPEGPAWVFSLVVGALPAALLIYCARSWQRARARLRSLHD
jgi:hypothetical protein